MPIQKNSPAIYSAVVEQKGWCWAITSFGVDAYKASEKDLLAEGVNLHSASVVETKLLVLSGRERAILLLKTEGLSDYKIAIKLKTDTPTVQSGKNALTGKSDLDFAGKLKAKRPHHPFLSYR